MKTLFESLLDIDSIESDTNVTKYLSPREFRDIYKEETKSINIDENNRICIIGDNNLMTLLCGDFKAKNISIKGIYPEVKIKIMLSFVSDCEKLINFRGPNPHENYSDIESLAWFFDSDTKLMAFDLIGIAESSNKIQNIDYMFNACRSIKNIDLSNFNFSKLNTAICAFKNCEKLKRINLGNSNALIDANRMCMDDINLEEFNAPNMILSGNNIFSGCESLKYINVRYIDVSDEYHYNIFESCPRLENVNIFGLRKNTKHDFDYIDISWAISLNDKSWSFLFRNLGDGDNTKIKLPNIPGKRKLIKKYTPIAKQHNFKLI